MFCANFGANGELTTVVTDDYVNLARPYWPHRLFSIWVVRWWHTFLDCMLYVEFQFFVQFSDFRIGICSIIMKRVNVAKVEFLNGSDKSCIPDGDILLAQKEQDMHITY